VALAGLGLGLPVAQADSFVLALPLAVGADWVAMLAYLGGLSAATAMVIVETVALSTMISNDLVMPLLLRLPFLRLDAQRQLTGLVLAIRRIGILVVLLAGWLFFETVGSRYALASIGLISFAAVAQFAPPILAGLYWREANLKGAAAGLCGGVLMWLYTLVLPAFAGVGVVPADIATAGPFGLALLAPQALFGLAGLHPVAHSVIWSMSLNCGLLLAVSLLTRQTTLERFQAMLWVEVERTHGTTRPWRGEARVRSLEELLQRFLGAARAEAVLQADERRRGRRLAPDEPADASLVQHGERRLARAIGAASARAVVGSIVRREVIGPADLMEILDETSRVLDYSRRLEQKSADLERLSGELRRANDRLRELDRLKDEFIATVSHELRTPLTAIRSFTEILHDDPLLDAAQRTEFLAIVVRETERLTRLIDDLLDLARIESGSVDWTPAVVDVAELAGEAAAASEGLMAAKRLRLDLAVAAGPALARCDRDRLLQVMVNLLSNAAKFAQDGGRVRLEVTGVPGGGGAVAVRVEDDGPGVPEGRREAIFERFRQLKGEHGRRPPGSGLGLAISREIVQRFGGRIWAEASPLGGAAICFVLPAAAAETSVLAAE